MTVTVARTFAGAPTKNARPRAAMHAPSPGAEEGSGRAVTFAVPPAPAETVTATRAARWTRSLLQLAGGVLGRYIRALTMWSKDKAARLDHLRGEEARRSLTDPERAELSFLFEELDAEESRALVPALERLGCEIEELRRRTASVEVNSAKLEKLAEHHTRRAAS